MNNCSLIMVNIHHKGPDCNTGKTDCRGNKKFKNKREIRKTNK